MLFNYFALKNKVKVKSTLKIPYIKKVTSILKILAVFSFSALLHAAPDEHGDAKFHDSVEEKIKAYVKNQMLKRKLIGKSALQQETISIFKASVALSKKTFASYGLNWGTNKVSDEPYIIEKDIDRALSSDLFKTIFSISVVNRVPILINGPSKIYYRSIKEKFVEPGSDPEACLQKGYGSCGNQAAVGLALLWLAGIEAREVQFYYNLQGRRYSHIVPEVLIGKTWRIIDTTYGAYWIPKNTNNNFELATTEDVLGGGANLL